LVNGDLYGGPRNGKLDDKAHPPIHPVKYVSPKSLQKNEWRVFELICRQFLACVSVEAVGFETKVEVEIGGELFNARGFRIQQKGWLEVFTYDKWGDISIPEFHEGDSLNATEITLESSRTNPPKSLSESDLIQKMDKNGIGTDATIHEHIKTVQERGYAVKKGNHFAPTLIGLALVEAYEQVGV